jgi:acetylornithine/N-succinyldiaminopimelate aminotransferase
MPNQRELFYQHLAQTTPFPLALEIERAEGIYLYGKAGEKYMDLISGIAVSNVGHCNPEVVKAIRDQSEKYLHLMVYGEYVQTPQVELATLLCSVLPEKLNSVYFTNSGAEAIEGAMKLAKRFTGRTEIIAFKDAYHGSTQGALSVMGNEKLKQAYRPLLPDCLTLSLSEGEGNVLDTITTKSACVIIETIQGEAGVREFSKEFLQALRKRCDETGTLLILDEIQCAFGRTGLSAEASTKAGLFAFEHYGIEPDILCLAKSLGGGMPLGAFIAPQEIMQSLTHNPMLGHITTFGGHPVCCAAGLAALKFLLREKHLVEEATKKGELIKQLLSHPAIKEVRGKGLLLAAEFADFETNKKVIDRCIQQGVITDWFLFCDNSMRIAPPLIITEDELRKACAVILAAIVHR